MSSSIDNEDNNRDMSSQDSTTATFTDRDISTLGATEPQSVYRDSSGAYHKKHQNPRSVNKINWHHEFIAIICHGDEDEAERLKNKFFSLNGNHKTKEEADGMIAVFVEKGAKEEMCCAVLGIGSGRYKRVHDNIQKRKSGGPNGKSITDDMRKSVQCAVQDIQKCLLSQHST